MNNACHACLMPFTKDVGERQNPKYCSYCQKDDAFCFTGSRKEFQAMCYNAMVEKGMSTLQAKLFAWMIRFAPHWKK